MISFDQFCLATFLQGSTSEENIKHSNAGIHTGANRTWVVVVEHVLIYKVTQLMNLDLFTINQAIISLHWFNHCIN